MMVSAKLVALPPHKPTPEHTHTHARLANQSHQTENVHNLAYQLYASNHNIQLDNRNTNSHNPTCNL